MLRNEEDCCRTVLEPKPPRLPALPCHAKLSGPSLQGPSLLFVCPHLPPPSVPSQHCLIQETCLDKANLPPLLWISLVSSAGLSLSLLPAFCCSPVWGLFCFMLVVSSLRARSLPWRLMLLSVCSEDPSLGGWVVSGAPRNAEEQDI